MVIFYFNFSATKEIKGLFFFLLIAMTDSQFALIYFQLSAVQEEFYPGFPSGTPVHQYSAGKENSRG